MTTPTYINSPHRVLCEAYFEAGKTELGQDPNSEQLARGMNRLNDLMNFLQTQGLRLWLQFDLAITPVAGQNQYNLGPATLGGSGVIAVRPTRIIDGYYRDNNGNDRPLLAMARTDWDSLSQKAIAPGNPQGPINSYFVDKQVPTLNVYFWMTPNAIAATGTAHVIVQQQQPNVVGLTDTLNFGPEWFIALIWLMAAELSTGQPTAVITRCTAMAERYRMELDNWDVEDAPTMFQPDARLQYVGQRFT
jgi:hypothetical protein